MSTAPTYRDLGALGFTLLLSSDGRGGGEAKITWGADAQLNSDFRTGREHPAVALEMTLTRVEKIGSMTHLDFSSVMGVLVGFLQGRGP